MPAGRPSDYHPKIAEDILERLSNGEPLAEICREPGYPHPSKWRRWCRVDKILNGISLDIAHAGARDDGYDVIAADPHPR